MKWVKCMGKNKKKLAIFDLDGTLFDTRKVNYLSYKVPLEKYDCTLDYEYFCNECNGRHYKEFLPIIMGEVDEQKMEDIHKIKKELYQTNLDSAVINKHLVELAKLIKTEYYLALVTTASRKNTADILKHFSLDTLFELIVTAEEIEKTKPDPEGFIKAMQHFDISPENTMIFEDSSVGIEAARRSGASVFIINKF